MTMDAYSVRLEGLAVGYRGKALIRDIDVAIPKGGIVTLIGPNGAGKSTILKSIIRQLPPVAGKVYIAGGDASGMPLKSMAKKIAVVLTERLKPELMTCYDVVATGRYPYTGRLGVPARADEEAILESMRLLRVEDLRAWDFGAVSDGQRQRVLLARALCQQPEILILDEPTAFLDIRHKLELLGLLQTLSRKKGITVLQSLHEIDLAQKISDRVLCVKGETVFRYGAPDEIFRGDVIRALYDVDDGAYDPLFGSVELPRPPGAPEVFVLSGGGSGIPVFRALQRAGTPFCAGILWENDIDYPLARALAARVIAEKPFCAIRDGTYRAAQAAMLPCHRVIDAGAPLGEMNVRLRELVAEAAARGVLERMK